LDAAADRRRCASVRLGLDRGEGLAVRPMVVWSSAVSATYLGDRRGHHSPLVLRNRFDERGQIDRRCSPPLTRMHRQVL